MEISVEQRQFKRFKQTNNAIIHYKIHHAKSGRILGRLVDLSQNGFRLRSKNRRRLGESIEVKIDLPYRLFKRNSMKVTVTCKWCHKVVGKPYYEIGYEFEDLSDIHTVFLYQCASLSMPERVMQSFFSASLFDD